MNDSCSCLLAHLSPKSVLFCVPVTFMKVIRSLSVRFGTLPKNSENEQMQDFTFETIESSKQKSEGTVNPPVVPIGFQLLYFNDFEPEILHLFVFAIFTLTSGLRRHSIYTGIVPEHF